MKLKHRLLNLHKNEIFCYEGQLAFQAVYLYNLAFNTFATFSFLVQLRACGFYFKHKQVKSYLVVLIKEYLKNLNSKGEFRFFF